MTNQTKTDKYKLLDDIYSFIINEIKESEKQTFFNKEKLEGMLKLYKFISSSLTNKQQNTKGNSWEENVGAKKSWVFNTALLF
ncbi:hypothetical protein [Oceanobacillus oncorhynchi]|uniref:hypothetical protein n=1 Tax=Oceanobacillus oncorhynchi TaxID=545501 RepID=UPI0034D5CC55